MNQIGIMKTDAFLVIGNYVVIRTDCSKVFWGLKYSLQRAGGWFNAEMKAWFLPDEELQEWMEFQEKNYGWEVKSIYYPNTVLEAV